MRRHARRYWARPSVRLALYVVFLAKRDDLLELDARRRLFQHVRQYPGLHLRELARSADVSPNHAKYHLNYLERHGLVSSRKEDGYWRFFPRQEGSVGMRDVMQPKEKTVLSLLRRPVPLHTTLVLLERGEATLSDLKDVVGVALSTLHYHMRKMERAGLVASRKDGRERVFSIPDHGFVLGLLVAYRPPDALVQGFVEAWEQLEL